MSALVGCSAVAVRSTSMPSLPPILRSLRTTSYCPSWSFSIATLPLGASSTSWRASGRGRTIPTLSESLSSSTRNRPITYSFICLLRQRLLTAHRQGHAEHRPAARPLTHIDPAVVRVDDLPDDRQPEPRALWLGGEERAENPIHHFGRDPRAGVGDGDHHHRARRLLRRGALFLAVDRDRGDLDRAGAVHRLEGVGDEIGEDLPQLVRVPLD